MRNPRTSGGTHPSPQPPPSRGEGASVAILTPPAPHAAPDPEDLEAGRVLFAGACHFVQAAQALDHLPAPAGPEVAFAGRSNVGSRRC